MDESLSCNELLEPGWARGFSRMDMKKFFLATPGSKIILKIVISNFSTMEAVMGDLVRVKDKFQVTIPARLRELVSVRTGDYLEASICQDGILLRPKRLVDTPKRKPSILAFLHESRTATRTREEIDAALSADRASWDR